MLVLILSNPSAQNWRGALVLTAILFKKKSPHPSDHWLELNLQFATMKPRALVSVVAFVFSISFSMKVLGDKTRMQMR